MKELMQYFTLFEVFGILNGDVKYAQEILFSRTAEALAEKDSPEVQA